MTLKERLEQIKALETIKTPWQVSRIFGKVELMGSQVSMGGENDFVELSEFQQAVEWFVEQCGGTVSWSCGKRSKRNKL